MKNKPRHDSSHTPETKSQKKEGLSSRPTLTLSGVAVLLDRRTSPLRRSIWGAILSICFCMLLAQLGERLNYYFSLPVSVSVNVVNNGSLQLPTVTFCPAVNVYKDTLEPVKVYQRYIALTGNYTNLPDFDTTVTELENTMDIKELWNSVGWNNKNMIIECFLGRGAQCVAEGRFSILYTMNGLCLSYKGEAITMAGPYHGLYMRLGFLDPVQQWPKLAFNLSDSTSNATMASMGVEIPKAVLDQNKQGWSVVIHEDTADPALQIKTHGYYLGVNWNKDVSATVKEFVSQNTPSKPCSTVSGYSVTNCLKDCFEEAFYVSMPCRLPYMKLRPDLPYCRGRSTIRDAFTLLEHLLLDGKWRPDDCKDCLQPCWRRHYEYRGDTSDDRTDRNGRIKVYLVDKTYESVREEFSYGFTSLVADFGGMLGLLLGASVLTALEILEVLSAGLTLLFGSLGRRPKNSPNEKKTARRRNDGTFHSPLSTPITYVPAARPALPTRPALPARQIAAPPAVAGRRSSQLGQRGTTRQTADGKNPRTLGAVSSSFPDSYTRAWGRGGSEEGIDVHQLFLTPNHATQT